MSKNKSIGILNKGKKNIFKNNKITGFDIGIKDEGEQSKILDNEFSTVTKKNNEKWYNVWWGKMLISITCTLIAAFLIYKLGWN